MNDKTKAKSAFTLSEVLITLVIIGIVAALTIPTVIQNTQKKQFVSAYKKTYVTLSSATKMIMAEHGSPKGDGGWAVSAENVYALYKKHLSKAKDCGPNSGCFSSTYGNVNSGSRWLNWDNETSKSRMVLADGVQVMFSGVSNACDKNDRDYNGSMNVCERIFVDLNGEKGPNKIGRDFLEFVLKEDGLYPSGCDSRSCPAYPNACGCRVIREDAMNY